MGSFSIWHWVIVLIVVVLLFGTKKLRNVGGDLGSAIKSFRRGMADSEDEAAKLETESKDSAASKATEAERQARH